MSGRIKTVLPAVCLALVLVAAAVCLWGAVEPSRTDPGRELGYESLLFDRGRVHSIDLSMRDWESFTGSAVSEEYRECEITVDGENLGAVGIRAKGNTSLSAVSAMGSSRYSFKVEFDHYAKGKTYYGLDKLNLNNLILDPTLMKDCLAYALMEKMGVPAPLCSYAQVTVNGEPWGLYLAVEGVENAFLQRNGMTRGELYKPDSMADQAGMNPAQGPGMMPGMDPADQAAMAPGMMPGMDPAALAGMDPADRAAMAPGMMPGMNPPGGGSGEIPDPETGNNDVLLIYSDDRPESYSHIFDNAKTAVSPADKSRLIASLRKLNAQEDLGRVIDRAEITAYLAANHFLCNEDSYTGAMGHNYYLYEENGKLTIIPWDYNLAFGGLSASASPTATVNLPMDDPASDEIGKRPLVAWIFSDPEALAAYHECYGRLVADCVESGWLSGEIERVRAMIAPYLEQDPTAFVTPEQFETAVGYLRIFCEKRGQSLRGQLDGTIPSTAEGQSGSDTLVDAGEIVMADLGSVDDAAGAPVMPFNGSVPGMLPGTGPEGMGNAVPPGMMPEGMENPVPPGMMPEGMDSPVPPGPDPAVPVWIAVSAAALLAAYLVLRKTRGHNG